MIYKKDIFILNINKILLLALITFCSCIYKEQDYKINELSTYSFRSRYFNIESTHQLEGVLKPSFIFGEKDSLFDFLSQHKVVVNDTLEYDFLKNFLANKKTKITVKEVNYIVNTNVKRDIYNYDNLHFIISLNKDGKMLDRDTITFQDRESPYFFYIKPYFILMNKYYISNGHNYDLTFYDITKQ